jgi:hypothetical protein
MTWRTGTKNPHTLYLDEGDVSLPQGFIMNPGAARAIVEAMNAAETVVDDPVWLRNEVRRLRGVLKERFDRTEAERAVLDACKALDDHAVIVMAKGTYCAWGEDVAKAELARRKLAP